MARCVCVYIDVCVYVCMFHIMVYSIYAYVNSSLFRPFGSLCLSFSHTQAPASMHAPPRLAMPACMYLYMCTRNMHYSYILIMHTHVHTHKHTHTGSGQHARSATPDDGGPRHTYYCCVQTQRQASAVCVCEYVCMYMYTKMHMR
jgi:hypothetical protein